MASEKFLIRGFFSFGTITSQTFVQQGLRLMHVICCERLHIRLKEEGISDEESISIELELSIRLETASEQSLAMNSAVASCLKLWNEENAFVEEAERLQFVDLEIGSKIPEDRLRIKHKVVVQCEDFGQSFTMPGYGQVQPNRDYFTSNLIMHNFVVANRSFNHGTVYLYDERV